MSTIFNDNYGRVEVQLQSCDVIEAFVEPDVIR